MVTVTTVITSIGAVIASITLGSRVDYYSGVPRKGSRSPSLADSPTEWGGHHGKSEQVASASLGTESLRELAVILSMTDWSSPE